MFAPVDRNLRQIRRDIPINSVSIEGGINSWRELQFDIPVDTAQRNSVAVELPQGYCDVAVDSLELRSSRPRNLNSSVNSTDVNRSVQFGDRYCTIDSLSVQS